ncbi:nucleotidyltransferase family protein [Aeoliella mucimassa]|uniref:nucleotidyltransferase family protein n=1 Tax=Aeoliella mucimassa TaxID=2527972 RepID=UPI001E5A0A15|nr:nucleotidyltransferase family protein [Aeoliella mucimassa]
MDKVKDRLKRVSAALDEAGIPYAVVGGNAVQIWVAQVDETAVRNTRDVDIVINRSDLEAAKVALEAVGFVYRHVKSVDMFLDGPDAKPRDAVHVVFAGEKVRDDYHAPVPSIDERERIKDLSTISLESLVRMKLTSFRDKDRMHLRDMLDVELIDESWLPRFVPELQQRLQMLIDDPDG